MALRRLGQRLSDRVGNYFNPLRRDPRLDRLTADTQRMASYGRYLSAYQGNVYRGLGTPTVIDQVKRITFNFCRPIVNLGAGWLAANPLVWDIRAANGETNEAATDVAKKIWDRSGTERAFLEAARATNIYGDGCLLVTRGEEGAVIEYIDPTLCYPVFGGAQYRDLLALEIAYMVTVGVEESYLRREFYEADGATIYNDDEVIENLAYEALPAVWVRNDCIPGLMYGTSDLDGVVELVDQYDHLARKQTQIVDYYAAPSIVFEGVSRADIEKDVRTVIYLPGSQSTGGRQQAYFLEWSGSAPDVEAQLTRIRNAIAEVSQVPAVAFGQMDTGITAISGIGLKILYGPLLDKVRRKQASWGPALERAMWLALLNEGVRVNVTEVNVIWPDPTPVDPLLEVQREAQAVEANLHSRQTAMRVLGVEDPEAELAAIKEEQELLAPPEPVLPPGQGPPQENSNGSNSERGSEAGRGDRGPR